MCQNFDKKIEIVQLQLGSSEDALSKGMGRSTPQIRSLICLKLILLAGLLREHRGEEPGQGWSLHVPVLHGFR